MTTLVYKYGLRPPIDNESLVRDQMRLAHRYRNVLTEIERGRRAALREVYAGVGDMPALENAARDADDAVAEATRAVKAEHAKARSRDVASIAKQRLKDARVRKRAATGALFEARRKLRDDPIVSARIAEINDLAGGLKRGARALSGVYYGSYLLVEAAADKAHGAPLHDGTEPHDPRFLRWTGDASLGVLVIHGAEIVALADDTRLRIEPSQWRGPATDRKGRPIPQPSAKRLEQYRTLAMRVGSNADRTPIWARWPLILDRPLPEGARIKNAAVHCRMEGANEQWSLTITLDTTASTRVYLRGPNVGQPDLCGAGVVAVDVGWRVMGDELRVASWVGEDGERGEIRLSADEIESLQKASSVRQDRDRAFDGEREALAKWLSAQAELPDWLAIEASTLAQWKSCARLQRLAVAWRSQRFNGDEVAFVSLDAWRKADAQLRDKECARRNRGLDRRKDSYRKAAASLARRYSTLVLEEFDLRRVARDADPASSDAQNATARGNRQLASISELRSCLKSGVRWARRRGQVRRRGGHDARLSRMWRRLQVRCGRAPDPHVRALRRAVGSGRKRGARAASSRAVPCRSGA